MHTTRVTVTPVNIQQPQSHHQQHDNNNHHHPHLRWSHLLFTLFTFLTLFSPVIATYTSSASLLTNDELILDQLTPALNDVHHATTWDETSWDATQIPDVPQISLSKTTSTSTSQLNDDVESHESEFAAEHARHTTDIIHPSFIHDMADTLNLDIQSESIFQPVQLSTVHDIPYLIDGMEEEERRFMALQATGSEQDPCTLSPCFANSTCTANFTSEPVTFVCTCSATNTDPRCNVTNANLLLWSSQSPYAAYNNISIALTGLGLSQQGGIIVADQFEITVDTLSGTLHTPVGNGQVGRTVVSPRLSLSAINTWLTLLTWQSNITTTGIVPIGKFIARGYAGSGIVAFQTANITIFANVTFFNHPPIIIAPDSIVVGDGIVPLRGIDMIDADGEIGLPSPTTTYTVTVSSPAANVFINGTTSIVAVITGTYQHVRSILANNIVFQYTSSVNFINGATTSIRIVAQDQTNTTELVVTTFVRHINQPPSIVINETVSVQEGVVTRIRAISLVDIDALHGSMTLTLSASHGRFSMDGSTFQNPMTSQGSLSELNTRLQLLTYQSDVPYLGIDPIIITINDNGNTGTGGSLSATATLRITITVQQQVVPILAPVTFDQIQADSVRISWAPFLGTDDRWPTPFAYELQRSQRPNDVTSWSTVYLGSDKNFTNTGLTSETTYYYRVRANNAVGFNNYSTPASVTTASFLPSAPVVLEDPNKRQSTSVFLTWQTPDARGSNVTTFRVTWNNEATSSCTATSTGTCSGILFVSPPINGNTLNTLTLSGLVPNVAYTIQVSAGTGAGYGPAGEIRVTTYPLAPLITSFVASDSRNIRATFGEGTKLMITFDRPTNQPTSPSLIYSVGGAPPGDGIGITLSPTLNIGDITYVWLSSTILQGTVVSTSIADTTPLLGVLQVQIGDTPAITNVGPPTSLPSRSISPFLTGNFGNLANQPTIVTPTSPIIMNEGTSSLLVGTSITDTSTATFDLSVRIRTPLDGGSILTNDATTPINQATSNENGIITEYLIRGRTLDQLNTFFTTLRFRPSIYYNGAASISLLLSISTGTQEIVSAGSVAFTILPINNPPSIIFNVTSLTVAADVNTIIPNIVSVTDPDEKYNPSARVRVTVESRGGSLFFSNIQSVTNIDTVTFFIPPTTITATQTFIATMQQMRELLARVTLIYGVTSTTIASPSYVISIDDLNNGAVPALVGTSGALVSATFPLTISCTQATPPTITLAQLSNNINAIRLDLSVDVIPVTPNPACNTIFTPATLTLFGTGATCQYTGLRTLIVTLGTNATIIIGSPITTLPNAILRCPTSQRTSTSQTLPLVFPSAAPRPVVSISAPATINVCPQDIEFTTDVSGLGGRPGVYHWILPSSIASLPVVASISLTDDNLILPSSLLNAGESITVSLTVTNFVGVESVMVNATVTRSTLPTPTIIPISSRSRTINIDQEYFIQTSVEPASCLDGTADGELRFEWTVSATPSANNIVLDPNTRTTSTLHLLPNTLSYATRYVFTLTVTRVTNPTLTNSITFIWDTFDRTLVVVINQGAASMPLGANQTLILDAGPSNGNTILPTLVTPAQVIYTWTCQTVSGGPCLHRLTNLPITLPSTSSITLPPVLLLGDFIFRVDVIAGVQTGSASVLITVQFGEPIQANLLADRTYINVASPVRFITNVNDPRFNALGYIYRWTLPSSLNFSTATRPPILTNPTLSLNIDQQPVFMAGTTYTIRVDIAPMELPTQFSTSVFTLICNNPPSGGSFRVTPTSGFTTTNFNMVARGWSDTDASAGSLTYQFLYLDDITGAPRYLAPESQQFNVTLDSIPIGLASNNYTRYVGVRIIDPRRGETIVTTPITIRPPVVIPTTQELATSFATLQTSTARYDAPRIFRAVSAAAIQLNTLNTTAVTNTTSNTTTSTTSADSFRVQLLQATVPFLAQVPVPVAVQTIADVIGPVTSSSTTSTTSSPLVLEQALKNLVQILTIQQQTAALTGGNLNTYNLQLCTQYFDVVSGLLATTTNSNNAVTLAYQHAMNTYAQIEPDDMIYTTSALTTTSSRQLLATTSSSRQLLATFNTGTQNYNLVNNTFTTLLVIMQSNLDPQLRLAAETVSVRSRNLIAVAHRDYGSVPFSVTIPSHPVTLDVPSSFVLGVDTTSRSQPLLDTRLIYIEPNPYLPFDTSSAPGSNEGYTYFPYTLFLDVANAAGIQQSLIYNNSAPPTVNIPINSTCGTSSSICPYECVIWNPIVGYTTSGVKTNITNGNTTLTCTPTASPQLIAIRYFSGILPTPTPPEILPIINTDTDRNNILWYVLFAVGAFFLLTFLVFWAIWSAFRRYQTKHAKKQMVAPPEPITTDIVPSADFVPEDLQTAPDFVLGQQTVPDVFHYDIVGSPDYQSVFALRQNPMDPEDEKLATGPNLFSPVLVNQQRLIYDNDPNAPRDIHFTLNDLPDPQIPRA